MADLGANFYLGETHVGKVSRADAVISQLKSKIKELNPYMNVEIVKGQVEAELLKDYNLVIVTELIIPWNELVKLNEFCRTQSIKFIMTLALGLYGTAFVDFGDEFMVKDATGENTDANVVVHISQGNPGVVQLFDAKKHSYNDGDYAKFREVEGMSELNNAAPTPIKVINSYTFSIGDTSGYKEYVKGGIVENVKMPKQLVFRSLAASLDQPLSSQGDMLIDPDLRLISRAEQLHIGLCALLKYFQLHNSLPQLNNEEQAAETVKLAKELNEKKKERKGFCVSEIDEKVVRDMALYSRAEVTSVCSFFGGVAAQEGLKCVGKYNPLNQWLHYDCFESLPISEEVDRKLLNSRYDDFVAIYGHKVLEALQNLNLLMVGAGALGCELMKAFALLGIATKKGQVTLTDNDSIEPSNLNRQFLFRQEHIGKPKSKVAALAAVKGNPDLRVNSLLEFVAPSTEHIFTEDFWENLDVVIGAVDNVKARGYMDEKCVWHYKPFLDAGTLGTKASTQVVLPYLTQSYNDTADPAETELPLCYVKNAPYLLEHTIEWARSQFEGYFSNTPRNAADYAKDPAAFIKRGQQIMNKSEVLEPLKAIYELIKLKRQNSFEACIQFACDKFEENFTASIAHLLDLFPPDYKDKKGYPFWTAPKRVPSVIKFDLKDDLHALYVQACAMLIAGVLKVSVAKEQKGIDYILKVASGVPKGMFVAKKVLTDEGEERVIGGEEKEIEKIYEKLKGLAKGLKESDFAPIEFEKDDENNFHVDYVHAAANLRARNYKIPECDKLHTRGIAGKIIPVIATATATIVGSLCNELIKAAQKFTGLEVYKAAFINLALPMFVFSEPLPPLKVMSKKFDVMMCGPTKAVPEGHTKWDRIVVHGPMTVGELAEKFKEEYKVSISMLGYAGTMLFMDEKGFNELKAMKIEEAVEAKRKSKLEGSVKSLPLEVAGETLDGSLTAVIPLVKYYLKKP